MSSEIKSLKPVISAPPVSELKEPSFSPAAKVADPKKTDLKAGADQLGKLSQSRQPDATAATRRVTPEAGGGLTLRNHIAFSKTPSITAQIQAIRDGLSFLTPPSKDKELKILTPDPHEGALSVYPKFGSEVSGRFVTGPTLNPRELNVRFEGSGGVATFYDVGFDGRTVVLKDGDDKSLTGFDGKIGAGDRVFFGPEGLAGTSKQFDQTLGDYLTVQRVGNGRFKLDAGNGKAHLYNGLTFTRGKDGSFRYDSIFPAAGDLRRPTGEKVARLLTDLNNNYHKHVFHMSAVVSEHASHVKLARSSGKPHKAKTYEREADLPYDSYSREQLIAVVQEPAVKPKAPPPQGEEPL